MTFVPNFVFIEKKLQIIFFRFLLYIDQTLFDCMTYQLHDFLPISPSASYNLDVLFSYLDAAVFEKHMVHNIISQSLSHKYVPYINKY